MKISEVKKIEAPAPEVFQRDIAPTILDLLGIDYREYAGVQGKPIGLAVKQAR